MNKKVIIFVFVFILAFSFVSAGFFSDMWNKFNDEVVHGGGITGDVVDGIPVTSNDYVSESFDAPSGSSTTPQTARPSGSYCDKFGECYMVEGGHVNYGVFSIDLLEIKDGKATFFGEDYVFHNTAETEPIGEGRGGWLQISAATRTYIIMKEVSDSGNYVKFKLSNWDKSYCDNKYDGCILYSKGDSKLSSFSFDIGAIGRDLNPTLTVRNRYSSSFIDSREVKRGDSFILDGSEGQKLTVREVYFSSRDNSNSYVFFSLGNTGEECTIPVCEDDVPAKDTKSFDENGCRVYDCPDINEAECSKPSCGAYSNTGKTDSDGCPIYECEGDPLTCERIKEKDDSFVGCKLVNPSNAHRERGFSCPIFRSCYQCNEGFVWDEGESKCVTSVGGGLGCEEAKETDETIAGCRYYGLTNGHSASSYSCSQGSCYQCNEGFVWDGNRCSQLGGECFKPNCEAYHDTGKVNANNCPIYECDLSGECLKDETQDCSIENGIGRQTCLDEIWQSCLVESCDEGFQIEGNICVEVGCEGSSTQDCSIENGVGSQSRICTDGEWGDWSSCEVFSCEEDYEISGNSCVLDDEGEHTGELLYEETIFLEESFDYGGKTYTFAGGYFSNEPETSSSAAIKVDSITYSFEEGGAEEIDDGLFLKLIELNVQGVSVHLGLYDGSPSDDDDDEPNPEDYTSFEGSLDDIPFSGSKTWRGVDFTFATYEPTDQTIGIRAKSALNEGLEQGSHFFTETNQGEVKAVVAYVSSLSSTYYEIRTVNLNFYSKKDDSGEGEAGCFGRVDCGEVSPNIAESSCHYGCTYHGPSSYNYGPYCSDSPSCEGFDEEVCGLAPGCSWQQGQGANQGFFQGIVSFFKNLF